MRFVQIVATRDSDGDPVLYALDGDGVVWWYQPEDQITFGGWVELEMEPPQLKPKP